MSNRAEQVRKIREAAANKAAADAILKRDAKLRNESLSDKVAVGIVKKRKCGCC